MGFEQILDLILKDPSQALALLEAYLIANVAPLTTDQLKKISDKFKEGQKLRKFGFTPSDALAKQLIKVDDTPTYIKLKKLIGKHHTLSVMRVGLYLEKLNTEGATSIVKQIRDEIFDNHGDDGLKIIDLASCGLVTEIIDSLEDLKEKYKLMPFDVIKKYEYIIAKFEYISVYIKNDDLARNINLKIEKKMMQRPDVFYVIASGNASDNTMKVIAQMNIKNSFRDKGYFFFFPKIKPHGQDIKQYIWTVSRFL